MSGARSLSAWHTMSIDDVAAAHGVQVARGLDGADAGARLARVGHNRLRESQRRAPLRLLLAQFADVMVLVLLAAAVVAGTLGERQDLIAIVTIVVLNAALGFWQELRAEQAVQSLRALAAPSARVRREGKVMTVAAAALVPGDIVLLDAGVIVPADVRLATAHHLRIDESALTGESAPADKSPDAVVAAESPLGDRRTMAYKGTVVTYGRGAGIVVATGMATELGRVAALLDEAEALQTPLQQRLRRFAGQLALVVLGLCVVIFGAGLLRGEPPLLMFLTALSLAVAAMPEALPAVVTVALALGARRMVARHALVRHLPAVETLGSVTYICTDKTGTLTQNRMQVARLQLPADAVPLPMADAAARAGDLLRAMALNSDAVRLPGGVEGDPTEVALLECAIASGGDVGGWMARHRRRAEVPFSSERGRMTTLHDDGDDQTLLLMKGAPERVMPGCTHMRVGDADVPIDRPALQRQAEGMAADGFRVLAFAMRRLASGSGEGGHETLERDCSCLGFVALLDPPRAEVPGAVAECDTAGIRVVMVTGDHPATARAIARTVGIGPPHTPVLSGEALERLDDETLRQRCDEVRVYARVAPEQKIRIVRALQSRGQFVAMTGDGINDAPALRQADIGIAMGRGGTDVAREAADMVLVDDNFASIVAAVREGRRIYDNIRRFIRYVLTGNSAEIWLLFLAPFVGLPLPLLPIHILWINLVTDGLPGVALAVEPAERDVMRRPPRAPDESVFAHGLWQHALWVGLLMGGTSLVTQGAAMRAGSPNWQSMTFTVLALAQLGHVLVVRSERQSLLTLGLWSNPALAATVLATIALQLSTLYVPFLTRIFHTSPLTLGELVACLALAAVVPLAVEVEKAVLRRGARHGDGARAPG